MYDENLSSINNTKNKRRKLDPVMPSCRSERIFCLVRFCILYPRMEALLTSISHPQLLGFSCPLLEVLLNVQLIRFYETDWIRFSAYKFSREISRTCIRLHRKNYILLKRFTYFAFKVSLEIRKRKSGGVETV
jgi:hypothetical protein